MGKARREKQTNWEDKIKLWSGRADLNRRPYGPEPYALAKLRHAPTLLLLLILSSLYIITLLRFRVKGLQELLRPRCSMCFSFPEIVMCFFSSLSLFLAFSRQNCPNVSSFSRSAKNVSGLAAKESFAQFFSGLLGELVFGMQS